MTDTFFSIYFNEKQKFFDEVLSDKFEIDQYIKAFFSSIKAISFDNYTNINTEESILLIDKSINMGNIQIVHKSKDLGIGVVLEKDEIKFMFYDCHYPDMSESRYKVFNKNDLDDAISFLKDLLEKGSQVKRILKGPFSFKCEIYNKGNGEFELIDGGSSFLSLLLMFLPSSEKIIDINWK